MTYDKRLFAEFKDLLAIRLTCSICETAVTVRFDKTSGNAVPKDCPSCNKPWLPVETTDRTTLLNVISQINILKTLSGKGPVRMHVELSLPDDKEKKEKAHPSHDDR